MNNKDSNILMRSIGWGIILSAYLTMHFEVNVSSYYILGIALFTVLYSYGDYYTKELIDLDIKVKYFNSYHVGMFIRRAILTLSVPATCLFVFFVIQKSPSDEDTNLATNALTLVALGITFLSVSNKNDTRQNSN